VYTKLWSPGADLIRHKYRARARCEKVARVFRLGFGARHERRRCSLYHIGCGDNNTLRVQSRPLTSTHHSGAWVIGWVTTPQANPGSGGNQLVSDGFGKAFYDIGHAPADHSNRRSTPKGYAVWEIHPVMKMDVVP